MVCHHTDSNSVYCLLQHFQHTLCINDIKHEYLKIAKTLMTLIFQHWHLESIRVFFFSDYFQLDSTARGYTRQIYPHFRAERCWSLCRSSQSQKGGDFLDCSKLHRLKATLSNTQRCNHGQNCPKCHSSNVTEADGADHSPTNGVKYQLQCTTHVYPFLYGNRLHIDRKS